jgi:hypothetical protein
MRQRNKELLQKKKRLTEIHSRIQELDKIFQRIYEDNISGKLLSGFPVQFVQLLHYEYSA